jgi:hypothetical protein
LDGPGRVADGGGADSMLWFWLKMGGDEMKCYRKMNRRQRARIGSMGRKCDTAQQCDTVWRRQPQER